MNERKIEALVDALSNLKGSTTNPDSELHQIRNPIGLQSFSRPGKNSITDSGLRVFETWLAGYRSATFDLRLKCSGESRAGLKSSDKLSNLLGVFGIDQKLGQKGVVNYLRRSLKDPNISTDTELSYFVQEN